MKRDGEKEGRNEEERAAETGGTEGRPPERSQGGQSRPRGGAVDQQFAVDFKRRPVITDGLV